LATIYVEGHSTFQVIRDDKNFKSSSDAARFPLFFSIPNICESALKCIENNPEEGSFQLKHEAIQHIGSQAVKLKSNSTAIPKLNLK